MRFEGASLRGEKELKENQKHHAFSAIHAWEHQLDFLGFLTQAQWHMVLSMKMIKLSL